MLKKLKIIIPITLIIFFIFISKSYAGIISVAPKESKITINNIKQDDIKDIQVMYIKKSDSYNYIEEQHKYYENDGTYYYDEKNDDYLLKDSYYYDQENDRYLSKDYYYYDEGSNRYIFIYEGEIPWYDYENKDKIVKIRGDLIHYGEDNLHYCMIYENVSKISYYDNKAEFYVYDLDSSDIIYGVFIRIINKDDTIIYTNIIRFSFDLNLSYTEESLKKAEEEIKNKTMYFEADYNDREQEFLKLDGLNLNELQTELEEIEHKQAKQLFPNADPKIIMMVANICLVIILVGIIITLALIIIKIYKRKK